MTCKVAVTFEFDMNPPLTWTGTIKAAGAQTVTARAVTEAKTAFPGCKWSSMNVCILERDSDPT